MKKCRLDKIAPSVLQMQLFLNSMVYSCLSDENQSTASIVEEEKTESRGQVLFSCLHDSRNRIFQKYRSSLE